MGQSGCGWAYASSGAWVPSPGCLCSTYNTTNKSNTHIIGYSGPAPWLVVHQSFWVLTPGCFLSWQGGGGGAPHATRRKDATRSPSCVGSSCRGLFLATLGKSAPCWSLAAELLVLGGFPCAGQVNAFPPPGFALPPCLAPAWQVAALTAGVSPLYRKSQQFDRDRVRLFATFGHQSSECARGFELHRDP